MNEKNHVERRLGRLLAEVRPNAALEDAVLDRVHGLRGREAEPERGVLVTRRAALVGAAGCAVTAGLVLGLPALLRRNSDENEFGLVIAQAAETGEAIAVKATSDGLMPQDGTFGSYLKLSLNLDASGEGLESVTYRVTDSPVTEVDHPSVHEPAYEHPVVSLYTDEEGDVGSLTLDCAPDANNGTAYLTIDNQDAYWAADETLTLLKAWLDLQDSWMPDYDEYAQRMSETDEQHLRRIEALDEQAEADRLALLPQVDAAHEAYLESFRAHAATTEGFVEWERALYLNSFTCAEDAFEQARLEATASFTGGGTQARCYRITLVDGYEQVLSERFDALLAIDDDFSQCLEEELPWHEYPAPTDAQIASDPRLSEPIFQIEDMTEA